jgi:glyoxylase-like metal-dependent hydrolase (beta-lactamase superfamily II)
MKKIGKNIIDVSSGMGGSTAFLILGEEKTALIDCGMAFCAKALISNIQRFLKDGRRLDYILLSHSHYDHIGAVPYLRAVWPEVQVLGAEYAKNVLEKEKALRIIKDLSEVARQFYGQNEEVNYDNSLMKVDTTIVEGDTLDLGNIIIKTLETPGHTRCSLTFLINDEVIFASETTGMITSTGEVHPCFIISYEGAINSIKKCEAANPKYIYSPHFGLVDSNITQAYWEKCLHAAKERRDLIIDLYNNDYDENRIFEELKSLFMEKEMSFIQPGNAFELNNRAMIKTVLSEMHNI